MSCKARWSFTYLKEVLQNARTHVWLSKLITPTVVNLISEGLVVTKKIGLLKDSYLEEIVEDLIQRPDMLSYLYNRYYKGAFVSTSFLKKLRLQHTVFSENKWLLPTIVPDALRLEVLF